MLDVTTLYIASGLVITIVTAAFVLAVSRTERLPVDLIWTLAFLAAISTALCYLAATSSDALWWFVALGNASSVVTTFAMWNGVRADDGRRPLLGVTAAVSVAVALAALLPGPGGGEWAGGWAVLVGTAAGALLGGIAALRGRLRHDALGRALGGVLLAVGGYYAARTALFLTVGPDSPTFELFVGTGPTMLVVLTLVTAAGFCAVAIRAERARTGRRESLRFDATTGLRTVASFDRLAREAVRTAADAGEPVALVVVRLENVAHLTTAFDRDAADDALVLVVDAVRGLVPSGALGGRDSVSGDVFEVLLPGATTTAAHGWADSVRRSVIATPLAVDGARIRLRVSLGVDGGTGGPEDLDALRARACARLDRALAEGGNRVVSEP